MRPGVDALEYTSVSLRTLFRVIDDATRERTGTQDDGDYADTIRLTTASLLERMGTVVREFGSQLTTGPGQADVPGGSRLSGALAALRSGRGLVADLLLSDPRSRTGLWELNSALLTTVDRMLDELDPRQPQSGAVPTVPARIAARQAAQRTRLDRRAP
jgi:hypothetical protein